jgi:hypothetical protein
MTQPESVIPPQPGWWVRSGRAGTFTETYGWTGHFVGQIPLVYGAKRSIILPNSGNLTYPILTPLRQAMTGGKILTRPLVDEYGDPGKGARTKIYIPNPTGRTYPILRPFKLGSPILSSSSIPVVFDSAGAGTTGATTSWSENHTIVGNGIVLGIHAVCGNSTVPVFTAKVGGVSGTPMVQLGTTFQYSTVAAWFYLALFGLQSPPTGLQAIAITSTQTAQLATNSISFSGVIGFDSVVTASGSGTSMALSASAASGQQIFQMFGCNSNGTTNSAYNQTSVYNPSPGANNYPTTIGYAPGAAGVSFTESNSGATAWGGIAVPVL